MTNKEIIVFVNNCLDGDKESYSSIVRSFQKKIYDLCYHFLGTPQDAEDAATEVFIKAYRSLGDFNPQYAFSTWLFRIAVNHAIEILRRQKRERDYLLNETANPGSFTESRTPEKIFFADSRQKALEDSLESLPVKYRTALVLKYQQDLSYQEIGAIMDLPVNTVGSLIKRGKEELKEMINLPRQEVLP